MRARQRAALRIEPRATGLKCTVAWAAAAGTWVKGMLLRKVGLRALGSCVAATVFSASCSNALRRSSEVVASRTRVLVVRELGN